MYLQTACIKDFIQGNPVHACGLHGNNLNVDRLQPICQRIQIVTKSTEAANRFVILTRIDGYPVFSAANINTRAVRMNNF